MRAFVPYNIDDLVGKIFTAKLNDYNEKKETISEKIRLLYVAITRAKEKFILIKQNETDIRSVVNPKESDILGCKSYNDLVNLTNSFFSKYSRVIDLDSIGLTKDYNTSSNNKYNIDNSNETITITPLRFNSVLQENKHFSKPMHTLIDKELRNTLDMGTYMHYVFEVNNFKDMNIDELDISNEVKEKVLNFLKHDEVKNISNAKVYKEHEIRFMKDGSIYHGFIDLLVEYDDYFDIIDYKLSNTGSEEYVLQLNGYKEYIESKYHKPVNIYLYSINKDEFKKLD